MDASGSEARNSDAGAGLGDGQPDGLLSPREREVLMWLAAGLRTAEIAHRMRIETVTVGYHLQRARRKLGARTREQALVIAVRAGHLGS
jgi:DNA-binding CsgD family transcriptional regulator